LSSLAFSNLALAIQCFSHKDYL